MKKLLLALALMLPMMVFTSCEKEDKENEHELVGTWVNYIDSDESLYRQFNADYTGCDWAVTDGETDYKYPFTWSVVNKNTITIIVEGENVAFTAQYSIYNDQLTFKLLDGEDDYVTTFQRVK